MCKFSKLPFAQNWFFSLTNFFSALKTLIRGGRQIIFQELFFFKYCRNVFWQRRDWSVSYESVNKRGRWYRRSKHGRFKFFTIPTPISISEIQNWVSILMIPIPRYPNFFGLTNPIQFCYLHQFLQCLNSIWTDTQNWELVSPLPIQFFSVNSPFWPENKLYHLCLRSSNKVGNKFQPIYGILPQTL